MLQKFREIRNDVKMHIEELQDDAKLKAFKESISLSIVITMICALLELAKVFTGEAMDAKIQKIIDFLKS